MKAIIDIVNGTVTVFDWVQNWAPTHWNRWNSPTAPMPVESISRFQYGFIPVDDDSRASWVLSLRATPDAPVEFEK